MSPNSKITHKYKNYIIQKINRKKKCQNNIDKFNYPQVNKEK